MSGAIEGGKMRWIAILFIAVVIGSPVSSQAQRTSGNAILSIDWSNSGDLIAVGYGEIPIEEMRCIGGRVEVVDETGAIIQTLTSEVANCDVVGIHFGRSEHELIIQVMRGDTLLWNIRSNARSESYISLLPTLDLAVSYDATHVARNAGGNSIEIMFLADISIPFPIIGEYKGVITDLTWNMSGTSIATSNSNGNITIWNVLRGELEHLLLYDRRIGKTAIAWSPDERYIALGEETGIVAIWDLFDHNAAFRAHDGIARITALDWNPDGTMLASASEDGTVRVWDAERGELIETFTYTGPVYALDWSPDGTKIAFGGEDVSGESPEVVIVDAPGMPEVEARVTP